MALGSEVSENSAKNASLKVKKCPANSVNDKCAGDSVSKGKWKIVHARSQLCNLNVFQGYTYLFLLSRTI